MLELLKYSVACLELATLFDPGRRKAKVEVQALLSNLNLGIVIVGTSLGHDSSHNWPLDI